MAFKLTLKGFQSHKNTELDIRGNFVCVTGPNNVGKSAIIRAVRWLFYDALRGSRFVRNGESTASVELAIDGRRVARVKGSGRNAYEIDGAPYESINKGTPPEVASALSILPVTVDKDVEIELNVVRQAEHPFLVGVPASAKAKALNVLTGHHVLDVAIRETSTIGRRFKTEDGELSTRAEKLTNDLTVFADLPTKVDMLNRVKEVFVRIEALTARLANGRRLLALRQSLEQNINALLSRPFVNVSDLDAKIAALDSAYTRKHALTLAKQRLQVAQSTVAMLSNRPKADTAALEALISRLDMLELKRTYVRNRNTALAALQGHQSSLEFTRTQMERTKSQLKMLVGSTCGECGQALSADCLEVA